MEKITEYVLKFGLAVLGIIYPLVMWWWIGPQPSISEYFLTQAQVLFLLINAGTSFYFANTSKWQISGVLLLLLSCFSVEFYPTLHNIFAILFFISGFISILRSKRYKIMSLGVFLGLFGLFHSIFLAEYIAVVFMSLFHMLILRDLFKLHFKRHKLLS